MSMQAELNRFEKSIEHLSSPQLISLYQNFPKDPKNTDMYYQKLTTIGRRNLIMLKSKHLPYSVKDLPLVKKTQPRPLLATSYYVAKPVSNERVKSALALIQESSLCLSISAERHQAPFAIRAFRAPTRVLQEPLALLQEAPEAPLQEAPDAPLALLDTEPEAPLALRAPLALLAPSASQRFFLFLIFFLLVLTIFWFNAVEVPQEVGVDPSSRIIAIATNNINKNV